ncbi:uncharacterized protein LOC143279929 [Babylonia areolata]|uniref:uncharacterized protein LOC143279929 n=1 Tax=Babylonia areolata TaxID=304850 RepID=UPI003FD4025E
MYQAKDFHVEMLEVGVRVEAYVSHVTDPDNFYIQLSSCTDSLNKIAETLDHQFQGKTGEEHVWHLGEPCAAMYDGQFSRGRVTGTPHNRDSVEVTFVDYGNKEYLLKKDVFPLSPALLSTPVLSHHCCLEGVSSPDNFWTPEKIAKFEDFVLDKELTIHIVSYDELQDVYHLLLLDDNWDLINKQFAKVSGSQYQENRSIDSGMDQKVAALKKTQAKPTSGTGSGKGLTQLQQLDMNVGDKANVTVAYVSTPSEWCCNLTKYTEKWDSLADQMATTYKDPTIPPMQDLRPGSLCAAFVKGDKVWYRASVEKVLASVVQVIFLDYGNTDRVPADCVKELKEEFRGLPAQSIRCCLHGVVSDSGLWTDAASDQFEQLVMYKDYTATVMEKDEWGRHHVSLIDCSDNSNVATTFLKMCPEASKGAAQFTPPTVLVDMPKYAVLDIQPQRKAEVFISWVKTPGEFYVQLADNQKVLDAISDDLQDVYRGSKAQSAANVTIGAMVAAKFSEDGQWYRAVVKKVSGTSSEVEFVDFGNSDHVPTDSPLKLEDKLCAIPAQAVRCSLSGIRPLSQGSTWSGDAKEFLETLTEKGAICTFLSRSGDTYQVDLEVQGKSIAREMIALAVVRGSTPDPTASAPRFQKYRFVEPRKGQSRKAYVPFVESVESFYLQLSDGMGGLEELMQELQLFYGAGNGKPIHNPVIGQPCAAKYQEDGQWYRAEVRSFTVRDVDVFFVDYGNTQSGPKSSVFQLESSFITKVEAQALHCQLGVAESRNADAQLEKFNAFTGDEELDVVIKGKEGSKYLVDLVKGGVSVTDELKGIQATKAAVEKPASGYTPGKVSPGQTVSAFASFIESPARFWIQLAGCDDELTSMMETLSGHYGSGTEPPLKNPVPGQACVALYNEDKQWYRASVLSIHGTEIKVQFVDYGNTELVDRQNIKSISAGFMSSPLLAVECCLDGFQSCSMSDDAIYVMESVMTEQELSVTFKGPKVVAVKAGNKDVAQALRDKGLGPRSQTPAQSKASSPQSTTQSSHRSTNQSLHRSDSGSSGLPSSGSFRFKEAVPPSGSAEAIITHVDEKSGMLYVQLLSSESHLQQLSSKLQSVYGSGGSPLLGPPVKGMACCAKFQLDACWYRAMVEQVFGAKVQVQFVDYGNSDTVAASSLKSITADLVGSPKHAFFCKLKGLKAWTAQTYEALCRCMDEELNVRFVTSSSPFEIQASVKGQDLLQMMFRPPVSPPQSSLNSRSPSSPPRPTYNPNPSARDYRDVRLSGCKDSNNSSLSSTSSTGWYREGKCPAAKSTVEVKDQPDEQVFRSQDEPVGEQTAYVSQVSEDGTFYVQLVKDIEAIDEMTYQVTLCPKAAHPSPVVGAACGALFSEDNEWYRGRIQSVSGSSAKVLFIDYGNSETCEIRTLKPLPALLLAPPLAYHCQVGGVGLTAEQQKAFRKASDDKEFKILFRGGAPLDVTVKDENGTNLADTILRPTTVPQPKVPSQTVHATVSHVGEDGHFYLQLNSDLDTITELAEEVQAVGGQLTDKLESFDEGQVCLAKYSEDDAWYRASIVSSSGDAVTVLFVDYGNTDIVDKNSVLVLPPSLMAKPAFAFDCKIPGVKKWKEGQKQKFEAMTDGKTMNARFLSSKLPYEVELTLDIGLELEDESVEETTGKEESSVVSAEEGKNKEDVEEHAENFEIAEEPAEKEQVEELAERVQQQAEDVEKHENIEPVVADSQEQVESGEVSVDDQECAEMAGSEEEFSDAKEPLEDSMPAEDLGDGPSKTARSEYPPQTPPALDACIVSHLNQDGTFYLQLLSEDESREKMSDKLQDECESADSKTIESPSVGLPCCAKYSEDEAWYRATVEKVDDKMVEVLFVDFGNKDCIPIEDLRELSTESLQVPPLAYKCVLEDCDTELVSSKLEEATLDQTLTVTFSTTETIPYSVNLQLENGTNISAMLVRPAEQSSSFLCASAVSEESATAHGKTDVVTFKDRKHVALEHGHRIRVTVSHVTSPSLFYVQRDDLLGRLEEMSDAMFEHYSSLAEEDGVIESLAVDQLCACPFGEDGSWYRATVQRVDSEADTCDLFYMDYGNSDTVSKSSVRELLAEFEALPWQCVSCSLAGVSCQGDWNDQAAAAFENMVASKSMTADILSGNGVEEPYLVHLFDQEKSVAESLQALSLPGVEAAEIPPVKPASATDRSSSSDLDKLNPSQEAVESGLAEKENVESETVEDFDESEQEFSRHLHECKAQETVDDFDESEQEFSRQLKACTAHMESTMVEEVRSARQNINSTASEEPSAMTSQEEQGKEEEEEEEEEGFEDAVESEQNSVEEDGNVADDVQVAYSCVSDGLAELEWLDIHVCVAVSASEFWCQLPSARSILSGTTLGIERAQTSDVAKNIKVGNLYLVCDPPHTNCRGKVLSGCDDSGRVLVLKLDYGTEERVPTKCLYPLVQHQLELPAQAFCCCLGDDDEVKATPEWLNDVISRGEAVDMDLQVKVVGRKADRTLLVDVQERPGPCKVLSAVGSEGEGGDVSSSKVGVGAEPSMETLEISQPVLQSTILGDTLSQSRMDRSEDDREYIFHSFEDEKDYEVTVAPGGRPDNFFVVETAAKGLLEALADDIEGEVKERSESAADGEWLAMNSPCLVLDSHTSTWFRGQVKSTGDTLTVLCVDRGVTLEVGREGVRELPARLLDTPTQAVPCCLADVVPVDDEWCEAATTHFTEFVSSGPLKLTAWGLLAERLAYKATLCDESRRDGDLTASVVGTEPSVNRNLVELGYAEAVPGSALDVGLQVERTINDPDKIEEMETSFTEQSLFRENSLGDVSEAEDSTEQDRDLIQPSGDAPATASDAEEESKQH